MTTIFKIAIGHDVAAEDMTAFDPQPSTRGMQYTRRQFAASGGVTDELPFIDLVFELLEDPADYQAILTLSGLLVATTALVSVQIEDENYDPVLRNGRAAKPFIGSDGQRSDMELKGFVLLIKSLQAQA